MKNRRTRILIALAGVLVIIQFLPPSRRDNPSARATIEAPPEVMSILRRSCFDCHSHETQWPWYSRVAPISWLVTHDVHEGRGEMNFSTWKDLEPRYRERGLDKLLEEVVEGEMPQSRYLWLHPQARIAPEDLEQLKAWVEDMHLR